MYVGYYGNERTLQYVQSFFTILNILVMRPTSTTFVCVNGLFCRLGSDSKFRLRGFTRRVFGKYQKFVSDNFDFIFFVQ
jgi:hypothetical protein